MGRRSILVVDDDEDVRTMLCLVLSAEGYLAVGAGNGADALKHIRSQGPPALMFIDLMMPRMNGVDLIRTLEQDQSLTRIPVAIMSGQASARTLVDAPPVVARLVKPVELDELLTIAHRFAA